MLSNELDATGKLPTLFDDLMRLDDSVVIHKFAEGKKTVEMTALDLALAKIKGRKPMKFSEKLRSDTKTVAEDEIEKVQRFSEEPNFANALTASGSSSKEFVRKFTEAKKKRPDLTAAQYGVPSSNGN